MHGENFLPEQTGSGKSFRVVGGSVGRDDAVSLTRGVAVGVEVNRADFLASVDLDIEVHAAGIYAIGCTPEKHVFRVNDSEIMIPYTAVKDFDEILEQK